MTLWVTFEHAGTEGFGILDGETIQVHAGAMFDAPAPSGQAMALGDVRLLAPVRPGKFIGLRNNFHALAAKPDQPGRREGQPAGGGRRAARPPRRGAGVHLRHPARQAGRGGRRRHRGPSLLALVRQRAAARA